MFHSLTVAFFLKITQSSGCETVQRMYFHQPSSIPHVSLGMNAELPKAINVQFVSLRNPPTVRKAHDLGMQLTNS